MKLNRRIVLIIVLLLNSAVLADRAPTPHFAEYKVKISILRGHMSTRLEWDEGKYIVSSNVRPTGIARLVARGSIQEQSLFTIVAGRVRPIMQRSADTLSTHGQNAEMYFDWSANEVVGTADGETFTTALSAGAVDRTSLQYALMVDLLNERLQSEYVLQELDGVKVLTVTRRETKTVKVPYGKLEVVGITHISGSSSRSTTLWCAPSLGFLPVIIEQYRDGKLKGRVVLAEYSTIES